MPDLMSSILPQLEDHRFEGIDTGQGTIHPAYNGYSLINLPASVCSWLGTPEFGESVLDTVYTSDLHSRYRHVIVMLVDGLGLDLFQRFVDHQPWQQWLPEAQFAPLTSITPSTTSSALTTLWTGKAPAAHGVLGYEMWLKEYGLIANMILHSPASFNGDVGSLQRAGFSSTQFLPVPTLGRHLAQYGVDVFALQPYAIARSGLSTMLLNGTEVVPYRNLSDLWVTLAELLQRQQANPTYMYVYWGDIDELSHRFGPHDERVLIEFETFSRTLNWFIRQQRKKHPGDTLFIMLADHGQVSTPLNPQYELRNHPALLNDLVMLPSGENRLPYFFLRPGHENHARDYIGYTWPGEFRIVPSAAVLRSGLFGPGKAYDRVPERLGDWVAFPQGSAYFWWADKPNPLLGRHGGLSPQEMLVPFWAMEL